MRTEGLFFRGGESTILLTEAGLFIASTRLPPRRMVHRRAARLAEDPTPLFWIGRLYTV